MEAVFCTIYILWLETEPRMHFGEDNYALPCPLLIGYESYISSNYRYYAHLALITRVFTPIPRVMADLSKTVSAKTAKKCCTRNSSTFKQVAELTMSRVPIFSGRWWRRRRSARGGRQTVWPRFLRGGFNGPAPQIHCKNNEAIFDMP